MRIIFDIDGTLTDYNKYIQNTAVPYFEKHYGMVVKYPHLLELEDILDMNTFFAKEYNCNFENATQYTKIALNKYWISPRFITFSLLSFRKGTRKFIKKLRRKGHTVEIHSSRAKTGENSFMGFIARFFTYLQFIRNGIILPPSSFYFYRTDMDKMNGIIKSNPHIVFDDKPDILQKLPTYDIKAVCIKGWHNKNIEANRNIKIIEDFTDEEIDFLWKMV